MRDYEQIAKELAYLVYQLMEGDIPNTDILQKYGYVDENFEWIYEDED